MGVSYYIYVGPYILVHNPPQPDKEEYHSCSNKKCKQHGQPLHAKFCSECGKEIKLLSFPNTKRVDLYDTITDLDDTLSEACTEYPPDNYEDHNFLIPNKKGNGEHFRAYDTTVINLDPDAVSEQCHKFSHDYDKELRVLRNLFGEKNVMLDFGVIAYSC